MPFRLEPRYVLQEMTLPQALFMWVMAQEKQGQERRISLMIASTAVARGMGADKDGQAYHALWESLGGAVPSGRIQWDKLSDTEKLILLGKGRLMPEDEGPKES